MGKRVLVLHGWTYETEKWEPFIELLQKKEFNVDLLKIPGLTTVIDRAWTLDDYVKWLSNIIKEEKQKVILIGHSNGGRIAASYVAQYPGRVEHLVLIDSSGIYHNEPYLRLKRFFFRTLAKIGRKIKSSQNLGDFLYELVGEKDYRDASPIMKQTLRNLILVDLTSELPKINIPTLIIWGERDKITPLSDGKIMHRLIKNSKLVIINSARHSPQFTHTKEVVEKILSEINK